MSDERHSHRPHAYYERLWALLVFAGFVLLILLAALRESRGQVALLVATNDNRVFYPTGAIGGTFTASNIVSRNLVSSANGHNAGQGDFANGQGRGAFLYWVDNPGFASIESYNQTNFFYYPLELYASETKIFATDDGGTLAVLVDTNANVRVYGTNQVAELIVDNGITLGGVRKTAWPAGGGTNSSAGTRTLCRWSPLDAQPWGSSSYATFGTHGYFPVLQFDGTLIELTQFVDVIPEGSDLSAGLEIRIIWSGASGSVGDARWCVSFNRTMANGAIGSPSFSAETCGATTTAGINNVTVTTITATAIDSINAGDLFAMVLKRDGTGAGDTMSGDAEVLAVEVRAAAGALHLQQPEATPPPEPTQQPVERPQPSPRPDRLNPRPDRT